MPDRGNRLPRTGGRPTAAKARRKTMLEGRAVGKRPNLPGDIEWHEQTVAWWKRVWASPMADHFIPADIDGLVRLAYLVEDFNRGKHELAAEIRLQEARFGLSPGDRKRLGWAVTPPESVKRAKEPTSRAPRDPRLVLVDGDA